MIVFKHFVCMSISFSHSSTHAYTLSLCVYEKCDVIKNMETFSYVKSKVGFMLIHVVFIGFILWSSHERYYNLNILGQSWDCY